MVDRNDGDWASELTQQQMLKAIQDAYKLDKAQSKQVVDTLKKIEKDGGVSTSKTRKAFSELTNGLKKSADSALDSAAGFDKLTGPMKGFGEALKESSGGFKLAMAGVGGFGAMIGKGIAIYRENVDVIRALNEHGIRIEDSFMGIQDTLATTGMSLEEFNELTTKYAQVIGQNGLKKFNALITATETAVGGFKKFGLTTVEATEFAAEYLQQQRLAGIFRVTDQAAQADALTENMKQLNMYSKILKVSRQDIQAQTSEMLGRDDLQRMFFTMPEEQRRKAQASYTTMSNMLGSMGEGGKMALEMFTDMAAAPIPETTESFKQLAAYSPELAQHMLEQVRAQRAGIQPTLDHAKAMLEIAGSNKDLLRAFAIAGGETEAFANKLGVMGMTAEAADAMIEEERQRYKDSLEDVSTFTEEAFIESLGNVDENAQGMANLADGTNKVMAAFNEAVVGVTNKLVETFLGKGGAASTTDAIGEAMKGFAAKIREFTKGFTETDNIAGFLLDELGQVIAALALAIEDGFRRAYEWLKGDGLDTAADAARKIPFVDSISGGVSRIFQSPEERAANFSMMSSEEQFKRARMHAAMPVAPSMHGVRQPSRGELMGQDEAIKQYYSERGVTISDADIERLARAVERGSQRGSQRGTAQAADVLSN